MGKGTQHAQMQGAATTHSTAPELDSAWHWMVLVEGPRR